LRLPVFEPRTRLVNFRLSEQEFERLKSTCEKSGARSVSEYARQAVLNGAQTAVETYLSERWARLERRLEREFELHEAREARHHG
jgi:hypothetical protein